MCISDLCWQKELDLARFGHIFYEKKLQNYLLYDLLQSLSILREKK